MLTYAHVYSRMLTHAHECSRMLTYAATQPRRTPSLGPSVGSRCKSTNSDAAYWYQKVQILTQGEQRPTVSTRSAALSSRTRARCSRSPPAAGTHFTRTLLTLLALLAQTYRPILEHAREMLALPALQQVGRGGVTHFTCFFLASTKVQTLTQQERVYSGAHPEGDTAGGNASTNAGGGGLLASEFKSMPGLPNVALFSICVVPERQIFSDERRARQI